METKKTLDLINKILVKLTGEDIDYWIKDLKCEVRYDNEIN